MEMHFKTIALVTFPTSLWASFMAELIILAHNQTSIWVVSFSS